ncbi:MAG: ImmA/IrrE family metallo-endopeptidase [Sedimentisphaerales bacterium]|nr:ImmA/IrrE family metallo-endopeptidase [Sedimentisphaerales bacterium]
MTIGERLRIARNAIGYTLEKVEQESNIGSSSLSDFENDKREPKFSQLSKLAEIYKRSIDFFLTDRMPSEPIMLWRDGPSNADQLKEPESEFRRLCQQYHKLELCTVETRKATFPQPDVVNPDQFSWRQAESFARKIHNDLCLGDIPSASLKKILEERYYVKIFHLEFSGSAISTVSEEFGPAILLNNRNTSWRRNYDLAHELFHLLTWNIFRTKSKEPCENEEKLADSFASKLLMPEESLKQRIDVMADEHEGLHLEQLDDLAREFGVSLDAMVYRISSLFRIKKEDTEQYLIAAKQLAKLHKSRESEEPETLPERYCDLAQRALRNGRLSIIQFAKYMGISYKKAQEYLADDEDFTDEEISIFIA